MIEIMEGVIKGDGRRYGGGKRELWYQYEKPLERDEIL